MKKTLLMIFTIVICPMVLLAKDTITWRLNDWPPAYILTGPFKGKGVMDEFLKIYIEQLPEYNHKKVEMTLSRFHREAKKGNKVCHVGTFPEEFLEMSIPFYVVLPHQIIIRKDKLHLLKDEEPISLHKLLKNKKLFTAISQGRYGEHINSILDQYRGQMNIVDIPAYSNINEMLLKGRIDYVIEFDVNINYLEKIKNRFDKVVAIDIREVLEKTPYLKVYSGCSKTKWGQQVIEKLNKIILEIRNTPQYYEIMERWYSKKNRKTLRKYLQEVAQQ